MYLSLDESFEFAKCLKQSSTTRADIVQVVFPSALAFADVVKTLDGSEIAVGAQNVNWAPKGAYTGAVSAELFF